MNKHHAKIEEKIPLVFFVERNREVAKSPCNAGNHERLTTPLT